MEQDHIELGVAVDADNHAFQFGLVGRLDCDSLRCPGWAARWKSKIQCEVGLGELILQAVKPAASGLASVHVLRRGRVIGNRCYRTDIGHHAEEEASRAAIAKDAIYLPQYLFDAHSSLSQIRWRELPNSHDR